ncbi:hypothetical protein J7E62_12295 [Variovorax paradoxus]|nr:hypothetical protein [Variovorax paradoxus]
MTTERAAHEMHRPLLVRHNVRPNIVIGVATGASGGNDMANKAALRSKIERQSARLALVDGGVIN